VATIRPAWSFDPDAIESIPLVDPLDRLADSSWLARTGRGVRVAVVDSGIDNDHPAIAGTVHTWGEPYDAGGRLTFRTDPHNDSCGHGTACAGIIRELAPDVELMSVRVLGPDMSGTGMLFAAGLHWAIENGAQVINLSLGTTKKDFYAILHELVDSAYFKRVVLVAAANNLATTSFPSVYSSVISVASQEDPDPLHFCYNPSPPVEFSAPGIDVRVPWSGGNWVRSTGNSYAAPHITAFVARMLEQWPQLTPFQVKTILRAHAWNVRTRHDPH
jgi:subtilisin family serine protease